MKTLTQDDMEVVTNANDGFGSLFITLAGLMDRLGIKTLKTALTYLPEEIAGDGDMDNALKWLRWAMGQTGDCPTPEIGKACHNFLAEGLFEKLEAE
jgi:hypothetical protein